MKEIILLISLLILSACSAVTSYENDIFPDSKEWKPVNPEHFNKTEAERILEGISR